MAYSPRCEDLRLLPHLPSAHQMASRAASGGAAARASLATGELWSTWQSDSM